MLVDMEQFVIAESCVIKTVSVLLSYESALLNVHMLLVDALSMMQVVYVY